ncbi:uncharacterized protein LOC131242445 isoform X2 [Magnolia sinica]|uniref:uncharacterized protein LOC131242445 isoform X2 n=1 Tax=Magnolia sinica TaxID=86752 RepID=UPI002658C9BC|nr:uncharacterized protein LOC131242445 isoform X2 [Magnolia sinica]
MAEQLAMVSHLTDFEHLSLPCISLFSARTARGARRDFYRECPFGCKRDGTLMLDVFCHRLTAQKDRSIRHHPQFPKLLSWREFQVLGIAGLRPLMNSSVACNSHRTSIQHSVCGRKGIRGSQVFMYRKKEGPAAIYSRKRGERQPC